MKNFYILYVFAFLVLSAIITQAQDKDYFVSAIIPDNTVARDGLTWQTAFATVDAAIDGLGGGVGRKTNDGNTYNIYIAEGVYTFAQNATNNDDNLKAFEGNKRINFYGGFPIPTEDTLPTYVCLDAIAPTVYPVSFIYGGNNSTFRIGSNSGTKEINSTDLHFEGINYSSLTTNGGVNDGTFITVDRSANNANISMKNMIISGYKSAGASFIYYFRTSNSSFTMENVHVSGGSSQSSAEGGGFFRAYYGITEPNQNLTVDIKKSTFTDNQLNGLAGGILFQINGNILSSNNVVTFTDNHFCNNNNTSTSDGVVIKAIAAKMVIKNNRFDNNSGQDGIVYLQNSIVPQPLTGNTWVNNTISDDGVLYLINTPVTIDGEIFQKNTVASNGGAIKISSASGETYTIQNSVFCSNKATGNDGGAIDIGGGGALVSNNNYFEGNTAGADGGAIWANTPVTSTNDQFYGNTSDDGGAVKLGTNVSSSFTNTVFNGNTAGEGGAIYKNGGNTLTVSGSYFVGNKATSNLLNNGGGALYLGSSGYASSNNIYDGNISSRSGGAIMLYAPVSSQLFISANDKYYNNTAANRGGALYLDNGTGQTVSITNSEFGHNSTSLSDGGGAIRLQGGDVDAFNANKLYENTVNGSTTVQFADIYLSRTSSIDYTADMAIANSALQLEPTGGYSFPSPTGNYPKDIFGDGFDLGVGNSQQTTALTLNYTLPTVNNTCPVDMSTVCPTAEEVLDPVALITTSEGATTSPVYTTRICKSEAAETKIALFAVSGKPDFIFEYQIVTINGATQAITTSAVQMASTTGGTRSVTLDLPTNIPNEGVTYCYEVLKITDANNKSTTYNCDPPLAARVSVYPIPDVSATISPTRVCVGDDVTLIGTFTPAETLTQVLIDQGGQWVNSTSVTTWSWEGPGGYTNATQSPTISNITATQGGTYTLTVTDNNGCAATATVEVTVNLLPTAPTVTTNTPICAGSNAEFYIAGTASTTVTYSMDGGTTTATFSIPSGGTYTHTVIGAITSQTIILVAASNGNCEIPLTTSSTVVVNPLPTFTISDKSDATCFGTSTGWIEVTATGGSGKYIYYLLKGDGGSSETFTDKENSGPTYKAEKHRFENLPAGNYQIKVIDENNCEQKNCLAP